MSAGGRIMVTPEKCGSCGKCVRACPGGHIRVGGGYIYVDTSACDGCLKCVHVCERGALQARTAPARPTASRAPAAGDVAKVVVGSRAEAKALRKAAQKAERDHSAMVRTKQRADTQQERSTARAATVATDGTVVWSVADALIVLGVILATVVVERLVVGSDVVAVMPDVGRLAVRVGTLVLSLTIRLGTLVALARRHGATFVSAFGLRGLERSAGHRATTAGLVVASLAGLWAFSLAWVGGVNALGWTAPPGPSLADTFGSGPLGLTLVLLLVVVLGPFTEELTFRGVVLTAAGERTSMWPAIALTAAVFAASHASVWGFVPLFALGVVAGWLAWTRCSVWPAIALHASYNLVIVAAVFLR